MKTEITFPGKIAGLNGTGGLLNTHWTKRKKLRDQYIWLVKQLTKNKHEGAVKFTLTRYSTGVVMDYDNLVSTGKGLTDSLVRAGVIKDDKPEIIKVREYHQVKCKKGEQKTVILIEDI